MRRPRLPAAAVPVQPPTSPPTSRLPCPTYGAGEFPASATWAALAGWNVTIREGGDFFPGLSAAGDPVSESDFIWVVTVLDQSLTYFRTGQSTSGDPLWTFPDLSTLECVLRRANPGHLDVFFVVPP